jgi:hypothetical protein
VARIARNARVLAALVFAIPGSIGVASAASAASWVEEYPELGNRTSAACKAEQFTECRAGLERLLVLLDGRPDIECRLARATLSLKDNDAALRHLQICAASGLEFPDPRKDPALAELRARGAFRAVTRDYQRYSRPALAFTPRFELNDSGLIAEDITYDPLDQSILISSVRERKVVRLARDGAINDAWRPGQADVWGVFALVLDREHNVLWASISAGVESPPFDPAERGRSALLKLDARSHAILGRYELMTPGPHGFGDMALGPHGEIYVADGFGGGVYTAEDEPQPHLRELVAPGNMRSPQTPAVLTGGARLLIPDYSRGIAIAELTGGSLAWLAHPPELALYGIDGMYLRGRTLIAIQNGTTPERVLVMRLDATCSRIESWRVAVARVPGLGDPTHGVFVADRFLFLVNSGWERMSEDGTLKNGPRDRPPAVWELKLRPDETSSQARCAIGAQ